MALASSSGQTNRETEPLEGNAGIRSAERKASEARPAPVDSVEARKTQRRDGNARTGKLRQKDTQTRKAQSGEIKGIFKKNDKSKAKKLKATATNRTDSFDPKSHVSQIPHNDFTPSAERKIEMTFNRRNGEESVVQVHLRSAGTFRVARANDVPRRRGSGSVRSSGDDRFAGRETLSSSRFSVFRHSILRI